MENKSGAKRRAEARERKELQSWLETGLTGGQVKRRLEEVGLNKLTQKRQVSAVRILLSQFTSPLIYVLIIAMLITGFLLHDWVDSGVIGIAVVVNTILGFVQEYRASTALEALQNLLTRKAKVIRGGKRKIIPAEEIVPGDVVLLEIGQTVPADGAVTAAGSLTVNEAILTGESVAVQKTKTSQIIGQAGDQTIRQADYPEENKVYMGTTMVTGVGRMIVTATGDATEMGKIAVSLQTAEEQKTPLQHQVSRLARMLGVLVAVIALVIFGFGTLTGRPAKEMFELGVAIAVAAIPEGLAVSLTVILAIGMQRILRRKSLVRKLIAAETLGSVTVICADKTGTLTEGKMRVTGMKLTDEKLGRAAAAVCNDQRDPLEMAMYEAVEEADWLIKAYPRSDEIPFSPDYKYIATLHPFKEVMFVSGAPEVLLKRSRLNLRSKTRWLREFKKYGSQGNRLVAVASKAVPKTKKSISHEDVSGLNWLGVIMFEDPVREGVENALREAQSLGLKIKVITGDFRETAEAVLWKIGVPEVELFARVVPEEKLKIVKKLQAQGEVVAMTGDGVNDALALKAADIGIVVEGASDVAKETADMVLLDNNFATIVAAVEEGRGMFANLKKIILYLLSDSFTEVMLVAGSLLFNLPVPITAAQILWVNLVDDGLPDFALTLEPKSVDVIREAPQGLKRRMIDAEMKLLIALISSVTAVLGLVVFVGYWRLTGDVGLARSVVFTMLGVDSLLYVFSCKALKKPLWEVDLLDNFWLIGAVLLGLGFQIAALYVPLLQRLLKTVGLGLVDWGVVLAASLVVITMIEGIKWAFNQKSQVPISK